MTDPKDQSTDKPSNHISRRQFIAGVAAIGAGASLSAYGSESMSEKVHKKALTPSSRTSTELNKALKENVKNVVVIYAENRSFNNLFSDFPGLEKPLSSLKPEEYQQKDRNGNILDTLPEIWGGCVQLGPQNINGVDYPTEVQYQTHLPNAPFALKGPHGEELPFGLITRDLWHVFYQNQMQINGGKNDHFVAWADSGALTMGHYTQSRYSLRLWNVAKEFVLCDNFFQGAFGGSFLNHQYLISATVPFYPNVYRSPAKTQIATLQTHNPLDTRLKPLDSSPSSAMDGPPQFGPSALTPDGYAVNTMAPPYWPSWSRDPERPDYADWDQPNTLVPQTHEHIGDKLSKKNIDWAWYAGAWSATIHEYQNSTGIPKIPNFQYHHQPFNYFKAQGPEHPIERIKRLRDAGLGNDSSTNKFFQDIEAGKLPPVTFYKPQGNLNMHAGYAEIESGDRHIDRTLKVLQESPQWNNMVVIVTTDENGGWWDHVAPPKGDRWGPGSRIPALVVSPFSRHGGVDHTQYDTASILRLITRVFDLETLDGIKQRDTEMIARGQIPFGDLTNPLTFNT
ncbi:acid phosphatase [uncultured Shewanella sp.]|uniref:acid phosphatase n=1 Tax=uncultured Shewanella sp. TaxID=173975 RepID=UPI0026113F15|nr:acid phosphatase [uncultured Shewanella sp.]